MRKMLDKDYIIAYHGSRGGIQGDIGLKSRENCDFGRGFYMGTNPKQVKGLVADHAHPVFYTLKIDLSKIGKDKILALNGMEWVYYVLANRRKLDEFNQLDAVWDIINKANGYDFIFGHIADDRMNEAMKRFQSYGLTDAGLKACLESVDYGYQLVAKTEEACNAIEIISEKTIEAGELQMIKQYAKNQRLESKNVVDEKAKQYARKGFYLFELIEKQTERNGCIGEQESSYDDKC